MPCLVKSTYQFKELVSVSQARCATACFIARETEFNGSPFDRLQKSISKNCSCKLKSTNIQKIYYVGCCTNFLQQQQQKETSTLKKPMTPKPIKKLGMAL